MMDISNQFDRLQISSNLQNNSQIDRATWEYHSISVTRMPGFGFGIAVSGGRDNPHFANGDPSIAISDVLTGGPAEEKLQVNDRILSVNGVSLENVEYSTAVQVLRDSGNTVILSIKRRVVNTGYVNSRNFDGAEPTVEPEFPNSDLTESIKLVLTKSNKKDSFGIVLGCRLFIKELSPKVRDQLAESGYSLQEGDTILKIHNTYCNDTMEIKEAKKIISNCKDKLNLIVLRDSKNNSLRNNLNNSLQNTIQSSPQQILNCNNIIEENYMGAPNYTSQNLYVQPPSRAACSILRDEKSNLTPRGRGPLVDPTLLQSDMPYTQTRSNQVLPIKIQSPKDVIRPQFQRGDDLYTSRPPPYNDDPLQWSNHTPEPRFISFQKEGSVGIRLTGGNEAGIFVTAVQPGSPASLQGLTPGDKILKVNDMEMNGITREEAVLFLLSLQDRIDLIVQHCKDQYEEIVAKQRGDSFYIKTHFHYENLTKGEMSFKGGDIFRVTDTLHNGVVGSWQVLKLGDAHDEMQRGVIPNKSRAEELATAQFNATKKEINSSESRGNFFRRRKSTHRRSKSLSKDYWDDVVFSDSITKFPAYERVVLRHPGFVRPIILFGPISDICRENLSKDFPDKFSSPLQGENKAGSNCRIVRLSNIRDIMDRGKHALLDITPNAVDRLNYAQFYPIVIFLKAESKYVIKQLRRGVPKSAHRSSKKLLEQCIKLEKCWSHIFNATIILNDSDSWYRKLREIIDVQQSGAVWMAVSKPVESLSDDFLFPMTTSRLSYASSPESDLETNAGPQGTVPAKSLSQLVKSCSDPSLSVNQENSKSERRTVDGTSYMMSYNNQNGASSHFLEDHNITSTNNQGEIFSKTPGKHRNQPVNVPDFPPRVDRASKPVGYSGLELNQSRNAIETSTGREKPLFKQTADNDKNYIRNDTNSHDTLMPKGFVSPATFVPYESMSSYDLLNANQSILQNMKLGPNAPDDLKSVPNTNRPLPPGLTGVHNIDYHYNPNDLTNSLDSHITKAANSYNTSVINNAESNPSLHQDVRILTADLSPQRATDLNVHNNSVKSVLETRTDYGKYSRTSTYQDDYNRSSNIPVPFKPVPPPKPKNYKPAIQGQSNSTGHWDGGAEMTMGTAGDMFVMPTSTHHHMQGYTNFDPYRQGNHHENNRVKNPSLGNYRQKTGVDRQALDLAGSREQRGSAFELYRKPQIGSSNLHNSGSKIMSHKKVYNTCGQPELMIYEGGHRRVEDICEKCTYSHGSKNRFHVLLKSPLAALKSAFSNKNKLLRRMGSMHEPNKKQCVLKRQLSMVECNSYLYKKRTLDNDFFHEIPFPNERQQNVFPFENRVSVAYQTSTSEPILKTSKLLRRHSIAERVEPPIYRFPSKFQSDQNAIYQTKNGSFLLQESKPMNTKTKMQQTDIEPLYYFQKTYKSQSDWFERDVTLRRSRRNSDNSQQKLDIPDKIYLDNRAKAQKIRGNTQKLGAEFRERLQQTRHEKLKSITELNDFSEQKNIIDKASNECNNITDDQNLNNYGLNKTTKDIVNSLPFPCENQDELGIQCNSSLDNKLFEIPQNSTVEDSLVSSSSFNDEVENLQPPGTLTRNDGLSEVKISEEPNRNSRKPKSSVFVSATRDVFDELGGILCDDQWNVILDIPSGAIPAGVQQEIYFTVTDPRFSQPVGGPPLDMEKGETMLSPLVLCGPQGLKFLKPVTLNIPHFASRTPSLGLSIKATDSETQLKTNWDNIDLPENTSAHTVSVKIDHF